MPRKDISAWSSEDERAAETIARLAGFPVRKTLEDFDFAFQTSINKKQVAELAGGAYLERHENVLLLGPPGTGKTHCETLLCDSSYEESWPERPWRRRA